MEQKCKIVIDASGVEVPYASGPFIERLREFIYSHPIWGPIEQPKTVEGSVVHPIDDPGQLIEGPDAK